MQITKFSDYALRILIHLATHEEGLMSTREIAGMQNLPFNHLAKISQWLTHEGYVESIRGRNGGMRLALPPEAISIGGLLRKSERGTPLVECMKEDGGCCVMTPACGLLPILNEAQEVFFAALDSKTLQDVLNGNRGMKNLIRALEAGRGAA
ncbi:Rrf2 family transcriptional regulator [Leisingera sp. ANG-M1]|uniref:RrF2 family transcriptional regulator n=1 Tax=unclassified Leisingera TaxID=2614906 RepID=UPI00057D1356|nr:MULTISPECIES: Rrf2 family transcriptional regulator [unclassified Leisingera]KIC09062.1 Rrf2 family transcriptional regulator [Leisingera sp. ANG-M1]KIC15229.1 Rrf2 family transcriptional regulator [Leisingera sp. ANG-Vp]